MPDRKGATLLEDLPEEIIDKILIRLPSKDVGRCRAVSTSWRTATSTPRFMLEHHRCQPSYPIIDGCGRPASLVVFRDTSAGASNQHLWPFLPGVKNRSKNRLELHGACDGFIIVSRGFIGSQFYIFNPVIRKHALLPQPPVGNSFHNNRVVGFYRYHPTGEYRVLWVSQTRYLSEDSEYSLYVLTVGANEPRHIRVKMPIVSSPSAEQKLLKELSRSCYGLSRSCYGLSVHHHRGSLHWRSYDASDIFGGGGDIIVFDIEAESFRCMLSPAQSFPYRQLFHMEGALALWGSSSALRFTTMDVWVMQDYEAEIWAFKYRIDLSMVEASRQLYLSTLKKKKKTPLDSTVQSFHDMVVLNERELLINFNEKYVLRCDIDGNFLGIVNIGKSQYRMWLTQHRFQESIIPIPAHEMQGEDEEPPFFTEHV